MAADPSPGSAAIAVAYCITLGEQSFALQKVQSVPPGGTHNKICVFNV